MKKRDTGCPYFPSIVTPIFDGISIIGNNDRNIAGNGNVYISGNNTGDIFCIGNVHISGTNAGTISTPGNILIENENSGNLKAHKVQILSDNDGAIFANIVQIFGVNSAIDVTADDYLFADGHITK